LKLQKTDFLAQGADPKGKGDFQGCGEFNPVLIFSQQDEDRFEEAQRDKDRAVLDKRNDDNAPNRRVMVLMFRKGSRVLTSKWPCPRASEGAGGCIKRFFSDGEKRRSTRLPELPRKFEDTKDTFACRFYQRISDSSPCHRPEQSVIRIIDELGLPLQNVTITVVPGPDPETGNAAAPFDLTTDSGGKIFPGVDPTADFTLQIPDVHEATFGDSVVTPSGQHFAFGRNGPRNGNQVA
jgi:hypothetical protein